MRWLRNRIPPRGKPLARSSDHDALEEVRRFGIDIRLAIDVAHAMRFDDGLSASIAAELVAKAGRTVDVAPTPEGTWIVTVAMRQPLLAETRDALRAEFEAVAGGLGGRYLGWILANHGWENLASRWGVDTK